MRLRVGPGGDPAVVAKRTPYYTNMVAYLAATRGATADQVATAMGLSTRRVHKDMYVVREWLGTNPRTGDHYLPDAAHNTEAARRGVGIYLVEDLLEDADLFRRLRLRGEARGADGLPDLLAALRLVVGAPYEDQRRKSRALAHRHPTRPLPANAPSSTSPTSSPASPSKPTTPAKPEPPPNSPCSSPPTNTPQPSTSPPSPPNKAATTKPQHSPDPSSTGPTAAANHPSNSPNAPTASCAPTAGSNPRTQAS